VYNNARGVTGKTVISGLRVYCYIEVHYLTCSAVTGHPDIGVVAVLVYFNIVITNLVS